MRTLSKPADPETLKPLEERGDLLAATEAAYKSSLRRSKGLPSLDLVVAELDGAYPSVVVAALHALGLSYAAGSSGQRESAGYSVELHPLDFEWYFNRATAEALADRIPRGATVLCVGTPTVAAALARDNRYSRLIDRNPLVAVRFPELKFGGFKTAAIEDVFAVDDEPDYIVLDAPWYYEDIRRWLLRAHGLSTRNTTILMSIFPQRTRATAWQERKRLLSIARRLGVVRVEPGFLHYETPLFEQEALRAANVLGIGDWRIGDLLEIRVTKDPRAWITSFAKMRRAVRTTVPVPSWETFVIGSQVIKLRTRRTHLGGDVVKGVPECQGDVLPTVSARDPRRKNVGLWSSRNRVLSVSHPRAVARLLGGVQSGASFAEALRSLGTGIDDSSARRLHRFLSV